MNPVVKKCPTCGSRKIRLVCTDYKATVQGRIVTVPDLEREECPDCGEVLFDCAAMERLESSRTKKRKVIHAAK